MFGGIHMYVLGLTGIEGKTSYRVKASNNQPIWVVFNESYGPTFQLQGRTSFVYLRKWKNRKDESARKQEIRTSLKVVSIVKLLFDLAIFLPFVYLLVLSHIDKS